MSPIFKKNFVELVLWKQILDEWKFEYAVGSFW